MRGVCECALKSPLILGRHYDEENKMIAGRQPDSGNPTVRDERRALRKRDEGWCSNSHEAGNGGYTGECLQPNHARAVILLDTTFLLLKSWSVPYCSKNHDSLPSGTKMVPGY